MNQDRHGNLYRLCPRCGAKECNPELSAGDRLLDEGGTSSFVVVRCLGCGLLFQNPVLSPELLSQHYRDDYGPYRRCEISLAPAALWYLKHHSGYDHLSEPCVRKGWKFVEAVCGVGRESVETRLVPPYVIDGRLLEIGCAAGNHLALLTSLGWRGACGIEHNGQAAKVCISRGLRVECGDVERCMDRIPDESLDVVVASNVIEHLLNPFKLAESIARKLRPGGRFLFSTVTIDSPDFRIWREHWYNLDLPRHLVFFRKDDIHWMLNRHFTIERVCFAPSLNDYVGSARNRLRDRSRMSDRLVVAAGSRLRAVAGFLARMGLASRMCVHAQRRF